jgi:hypothetical protein
MADKTTEYRNVSGETLWVDLGTGRLEKVGDGDVVLVSESFLASHYMQTGETGETPLWSSSTTPTTKPAAEAPAAEIKE